MVKWNLSVPILSTIESSSWPSKITFNDKALQYKRGIYNFSYSTFPLNISHLTPSHDFYVWEMCLQGTILSDWSWPIIFQIQWEWIKNWFAFSHILQCTNVILTWYCLKLYVLLFSRRFRGFFDTPANHE